MSAVIEVVSLINAGLTRVFDLELDVDVHVESLAESHETATTTAGRRQLALGDEVTFRARHLGLRWRMTSRVTAYDRPHHFVDEQTRGPFHTLRHEHYFEDVGDGRTRMTDRMTIRAPFGPLGAAVTRTFLAAYLRRLLTQRSVHIKRLAEAADDGR